MKATVYIIEDEALIAADLKRSLKRLGYEVVGTAYNADTAVAELKDTVPDLIVSDIRMRGTDGIEAIRQIKLRHRVAVIFITAHSDMETLKRAQQVDPQGYILKPINDLDLEIAVEMAIYKHQRERALLESRHMLHTALGSIGDSLLFIGKDGTLMNLNSEASELLGVTREYAVGQHWSGSVRPAGEGAFDTIANLIERVVSSGAVARLMPIQLEGQAGHRVVDGIVGPLRSYGDEVVGLVMLLRLLEPDVDAIAHASREASAKPYTLLLIEAGGAGSLSDSQQALIRQETSELVSQDLRPADLVTRYGGGVLAVNLPATGLGEGRLVAERIKQNLEDHRFCGGSVTLKFAMGIAEAQPPANADQSSNLPVELYRRAAWALDESRHDPRHPLTSWDPTASSQHAPLAEAQLPDDRESSGGDLALLWHTVRAVSQSSDLPTLSREIVGRVQSAFDLHSTAFFVRSDRRQLDFVAASVDGQRCDDYHALRISRQLRDGMTTAMDNREMRVMPLVSDHCTGQVYAVPLSAAGNKVGLLLMLSRSPLKVLDDRQTELLETLADYVAMAVERAMMLTDQRQRVDRERKSFERAVAKGELIYQSPAMHKLLAELRLVARTEASVLVTGESGTGKELLAKTIHAMSERRDQPLVVVDCSTIVPDLMESELFGHRKGAFTGATAEARGKVIEADGGTLFLDEIGELPLELQTKLLRFVQEGTFSPVGSSETRRIDTRLIVATNRDLPVEVHAGRFRADLFYRLNVFKLESPPLRQRGEDVLLIARYFLQEFAVPSAALPTGTAKRLSHAAEQALLDYGWPGNVRELRNSVQRASIVCPLNEIQPEHLALPEASGASGLLASEKDRNWDISDDRQSAATGTSDQTLVPETDLPRAADSQEQPDPLNVLRSGLARLLTAPETSGELAPGIWLEAMALKIAHRRADGNVSRAAGLLKMPESTYRRKLVALDSDSLNPNGIDPEGALSDCIEQLLENPPGDEGVLTVLRDELGHAALAEKLPRSHCARLMGVSEPTFRKWVRQSTPDRATV